MVEVTKVILQSGWYLITDWCWFQLISLCFYELIDIGIVWVFDCICQLSHEIQKWLFICDNCHFLMGEEHTQLGANACFSSEMVNSDATTWPIYSLPVSSQFTWVKFFTLSSWSYNYLLSVCNRLSNYHFIVFADHNRW